MKYVAAALALVVLYAYSQQGLTQLNLPRYQIVATTHGVYSVFRLDTMTGELSFCTVQATDSGSPVSGVKCTQPQL